MAGSYNKIILIGNLGRDPEQRAINSPTSGQDMVTSFTLATNERRKDGTDIPTWFRISAFSQLGETCYKFLRKGSYVYIEGALSQNEYTDRDGNKRQSLEVRAREMRMLDRRSDNPEYGDSGGGAAAGGGYSRPAAAPPPVDDSDDIPF